MVMFKAILTLVISVTACKGQPPRLKFSQALLVKKKSPISINFMAAGNSDAYIHTFASHDISLSFENAFTNNEKAKPFNVVTNRSILLPASSTPSIQEKEALLRFCTDISLTDASGNPVTEVTYNPSETLRLAWRTHHSIEDREAITQMAFTSANPRCLLTLTVSSHNDVSHSVSIAIMPALDAKSYVVSSNHHEKALEDSLVLINRLESGYEYSDDQNLVIPVSESASISLGLDALNPSDIEVQKQLTGSDICAVKSESEFSALDPDQSVTLKYLINSSSDFDVYDISASESGGRQLAQCADFKSNFEDRNIKLVSNCSTVFEVLNLAADEMCAYRVSISNPDDELNTIEKRIRIERNAITIDDYNPTVSNIQDAYKAIPESPINPISTNEVQMDNFNNNQVKAMKKAFDLWLNLSPNTYQTYFKDHIRKITFDNYTGYCEETGFGAYANYGESQFFWCLKGSMDSSSISQSRAPHEVFYIALAALHETLHTKNVNHDKDALNYRSCDEGTSLSAIIPVKGVQCKKMYCQQFKDSAIVYYISELNYSVGDNRIFEGKCAEWNSILGLTRSSF